jgi:hypothetical protein
LTLEGAKKRLLTESRRRPEQLALGVPGDAKRAATIRRIRTRLEAVRKILVS